MTTAALVPADAADTAPSAERWREILTLLAAAGRRDGENSADWWAQDTVGGRATADVAARRPHRPRRYRRR